MPTLRSAATLQINPPGASPRLTIPQVWSGLLHKAKYPSSFVNVITKCDILQESPDLIVREVTFLPGAGGPPTGVEPGEPCVEEITLYEPLKAEFVIPSSGARTVNAISYGEADGQLYLTFIFEWPGEGNLEEVRMLGLKTVRRTIDRIRELAIEGKL